MHEKPRGFAGFRVSPAAFLIDGIENGRTLPDWMHAHEKQQQQKQWQQERAITAADELEQRRIYEHERAVALKSYLASPEGQEKYNQAHPALLAFYKVTEPNRYRDAAHDAALARIERMDFRFPDYSVWTGTKHEAVAEPAARREVDQHYRHVPDVFPTRLSAYAGWTIGMCRMFFQHPSSKNG
jgi:hypothetical protein